MFCLKIPECSVTVAYHCRLKIFIYYYFKTMPRKPNIHYAHGNDKCCHKVTQKNPETTWLSFGPETPNVPNQNPYTNGHPTLSKCNAAMLDFSAQTVMPIQGNL